MNKASEYFVGIDVGSISLKIALLSDISQRSIFENRKDQFEFLDNHKSCLILLSKYKRIHGEPIKATFQLFQSFIALLPDEATLKIAITGSGGRTAANLLGSPYLNEFQAVAHGVGKILPDIKTILEIGGDSSKYIRLEVDETCGTIGIIDYEKNGDCAAGTGSFMDQQASRLLYQIEDVGDIVLQADRSATIAGRCSVFAKSDMIHAQQKGFKPPEILKGLCEAVVRNFKGTITKGKAIFPPVAFIGGVAENKGIVQAMKTVFQLTDEQLLVPKYKVWMEAIGCAFIAAEHDHSMTTTQLKQIISQPIELEKSYSTTCSISTDRMTTLRDKVHTYRFSQPSKIKCYLGIDVGSVTTKLVVIDENGDLIKEIYTRTEGRPIEVVDRGLKEIEHELGDRIEVIGVGTTGSGRELIGVLVGADSIKDEITAHKTGAMYVSEKLTGKEVDTIFDIGGQDSKYIAIENGIVVDFTMNEACAAGTGSFLEEQAEKLGISIKDEFSQLALSSKQPVRLGERCTVFMEKDITPYLQQGATKQDIVAGLAFSIVYNYLNRVVRGRKIGDVIYFQGGTAYNDAVASAFATILRKEIIVPPYNGVIGAIGAALLAKNKMEMSDKKTSFRGFYLDKIEYGFKNFTCKGCSNFCDIQQFTVEGNQTYWGNKCSDRYRKSIIRENEPTIPDLIQFRQKVFFNGFDGQSNGRLKIGIARSMYYYEQFPFWHTYFRKLGVDVVLSDETNRQIIHAGEESHVAEPCFPIAVAHGHFQNLISNGVDYVFQPNVINAETNFPQNNSFLCPWGQTLCFVLKQTPTFKPYNDRILCPNIRFAEGRIQVKKALGEMATKIGFSHNESDTAVDKAYISRAEFTQALLNKGQEILALLKQKNELAIVLLGRPYNIYDPMINLNIPSKLREYYGVNVIPMDFLAADDSDISDVTDNMYWNYGRKILQVAKLTRQHPNLHLIYITNFKCGPDSYIKHYVGDACQSPFLTLQFDGHGNDAGILTRCEAYLNSKGFLG